MTKAIQHVGVPGHQFQAGVLWDGSLLIDMPRLRYKSPVAPVPRLEQAYREYLNGFMHVGVAFGDSMTFFDREGTGASSIRRRLEDGRLPIPEIETADGTLRWRQKVFAHLLGRKHEEGIEPQSGDLIVTHASFKVHNAGNVPRSGRLWLHFGSPEKVTLGYKVKVDQALGEALSLRFDEPFGMLGEKVRYVIPKPVKGTVRWHDEVSAKSVIGATGPARRVIEWQVELQPNEEVELRIIVPYGAVDRAVAVKLAGLDSRAIFEQTRQYWHNLIHGPGEIITPDPFVNDYLAAMVGQMAQNTSYWQKSGFWMHKTSPNWYEPIWSKNSAVVTPSYQLRGLPTIARQVLDSMVRSQIQAGNKTMIDSTGAVARKGRLGLFDGWHAVKQYTDHGLVLWALANHYLVTRDRQWLGRGVGSPLQAMLDGCDWIMSERRTTMKDESGMKAPNWGLLPAARSHDWLTGSTMFNDVEMIFGMTEVVRVLREISHPRLPEVQNEVREYRECLRRRYREARDRATPLTLPGGIRVPYVPRVLEEPDWSKIDFTYTLCGAPRAGARGVLDPHDELVEQSLAFVTALQKAKPTAWSAAEMVRALNALLCGIITCNMKISGRWRGTCSCRETSFRPFSNGCFMPSPDRSTAISGLGWNRGMAFRRRLPATANGGSSFARCSSMNGEGTTVRNKNCSSCRRCPGVGFIAVIISR
jgi:hypothetical protein